METGSAQDSFTFCDAWETLLMYYTFDPGTGFKIYIPVDHVLYFLMYFWTSNVKMTTKLII